MTASLRCAIYTRKSSEEGLEQEFNSLHAQREACEAYVLSQAGEGWKALPTIYDDGGFSGGSIERPALKALLADVDAGRIDVVVVYKVDRLTRSLADFAKIVEIFDRRNVSFVSVTQAFNTTSSMGRLTLNVLLSFAQFEREVTGERIRDKIAASKRKGLWMGGRPPTGYDPPADPKTRILTVNEEEAETIRFIFRRYLELGSVVKLARELRAQSVRTKRWVTRDGREVGGTVWTQPPLYRLLRNRLYRGEIDHKGMIHPGQHPPIIDAELFEAVQCKLAEAGDARKQTRRELAGSTLAGRVFDDLGNRMSPVTARRGQREHRYYVSQAAIRGDQGVPGSVARVPAAALERLVERELSTRSVGGPKGGDRFLGLTKAVVGDRFIELTFAGEHLFVAAENDVVVRVPAILRAHGGAKEIVGPDGGNHVASSPDRALQRALARAYRWNRQIMSGERSGADEIAASENLQSRYVDKVLKLAWLAPDLVEAILAGRRLRDFTLTNLLGAEIPSAWNRQRECFVLA